MVATVEISLVSRIQAEIHVISNIFPVSAAICDLPLTLTSPSNRTIPVVLTVPKNIDIAVGISLSYRVQTEIYVKFRGRHLGFSLPLASGRFTGSSIVIAVIEIEW